MCVRVWLASLGVNVFVVPSLSLSLFLSAAVGELFSGSHEGTRQQRPHLPALPLLSSPPPSSLVLSQRDAAVTRAGLLSHSFRNLPLGASF